MVGDLSSRYRRLKLYNKFFKILPHDAKVAAAQLFRKAIVKLETSDIPLKEVNDYINYGDYDGAENCLIEVLKKNPTNLRVMPHITRVRFLKQRATSRAALEQIIEMQKILYLMDKELQSKYVYSLEPKWQIGVDIQRQLLTEYGVENFKRTVSHGYQNFVMSSLYDPQVKQLLKTMQTHFTCEPWFNIIEVPDNVGIHERVYDDPIETHFDKPIYKLANPEAREIYRIAVGLLWEQVRETDSFGCLEYLEESEIGNPIRIWRKGKLISSDLAHSVRERSMLLEPLALYGTENLSVIEIGAGHGRLAEVFGKTTNYRYVIFDITPALYVAQWYITRLFPEEKMFTFRHFDDFKEVEQELKESRFAFLTPNQIEMFPNGYFDLCINMNSLGEMRLDQVKNYLYHIDRLTTKGFMSRQEYHDKSKNKWLEGFPKETFALPKERWELVVDKLDDFHPYFFNQVWKRSV
jgi:putative sugar O-methyltransferase